MKQPAALDHVPARKLPNFPKPICPLIMGTSFLRVMPQAEVDELFDCFVAHGGNCFDTSVVYDEIEIPFGHWLKKRRQRDQLVIHAKGAHYEIKRSRQPGPGFEYHRPRVTPEEIIHDLNLSLQQLQTDYIDIYTLHRDDPDQPVSAIMDCLAAEQRAGRILAFGASNWTIPRIEEANAYAASRGQPGFLLSSPNLALAFPNEPSWPNCLSACDRFSRSWYAKTQMPLFAWSCLALGFFSGKYAPLEKTSPAQFDQLLSERWTADVVRVYYSPKNFSRLARAQQLASQLGVSATQIALAWVLHQGEHVFAVAGPRSTTEIADLFAALKIQLSPEQVAWLNLE